MPGPKAIVTGILDIVDDPNNPGVNIVVTIDVKFLFFGPDPMEQQIDVTIADSSTKAQMLTAVNNAIIAAAVGLGKVIGASAILTINDIAG
jgi:hypothetical protein